MNTGCDDRRRFAIIMTNDSDDNVGEDDNEDNDADDDKDGEATGEGDN